MSNFEQVMDASTKQQLYSHLLPITKNIQVRWTRHEGHCQRSRDEPISDVLLWTPSHGRAKAGRPKAGWPARTYIQQLCADTGCSTEDLLEAMDDREGWQERVRDIHADGVTWWWMTLWRYHQPLLTIPLYGQWSTSGSDRGNTHFFTATSITIEGTGEKEPTNNMLGVNSSAEGELCNIVHVQTNASVDSSETSTKLLECRLILTRSSFTGLDPLTCWLVSLLSHVDCSLASPFANCPLLSPFVSLSDWRPLTTSVTSRSQVQNPLSGFAPKQTKESPAWRTTYIVLQLLIKVHSMHNFHDKLCLFLLDAFLLSKLGLCIFVTYPYINGCVK